MTENDFELFEVIARMRQYPLGQSVAKYLTKIYPQKNIITANEYILAEGDIPILLVAHLDTVFKETPQNIYYDEKQGVLWSPDGLGADDRAGVFAILSILRKGYRPCVCFTTEEEKGGLGVMAMLKDYPQSPIGKLKYIIELDRQGENDCVFYSCDNEDFQKYVESFGFETDYGTYSDIADICPTWGIAGVNLSVGYFREHSISETLHIKYLEQTIDRVCKMLEANDKAPTFKFILAQMLPYEKFSDKDWEEYFVKKYGQYLSDDAYAFCDRCHNKCYSDETFEVQGKEIGEKLSYCMSCLGDVNWCETCGNPFVPHNQNNHFCLKCQPKESKDAI